MLDLRNLSVGYGNGTLALSGADLSIAAGQRLLVCGAAGSGKTTLLQAAAGIIPRLVRPDTISGSIELDGQPVRTVSKDSLFQTIGLVAQAVEDQVWDLSVEDLIAFPLENRGVGRAEIRARLATLIDGLELHDLKGRRVLTLSGGERRMVAIAAALAAAPRLLVLDEPTTGLDPAARQRLLRSLATFGAEIPSLLIAEQDAAAIAPAIDEIALLASGVLSSLQPKAGLMADGAAWTEAGLLPPSRRQATARVYPLGRTLLCVEKLRTALQRPTGRPVLEEIDLTIRAGECVALIGRNGAGKTTLFQSILGLAAVTGGTLAIGGADAGGWTAARRARSIAYLPQIMRRILFNMTVLQEVTFAITASPAMPKDPAILEKAETALAAYGLSGLAQTNPFALSTRQQALLGLACAEASGAALAILDEPLLARDLNGKRLLDRFIDGACASGRAVLLITHDLELAAERAGRVLLLDEGRITYDGDTIAAWRSPAYRALGWPEPRFLAQTEWHHAAS